MDPHRMKSALLNTMECIGSSTNMEKSGLRSPLTSPCTSCPPPMVKVRRAPAAPVKTTSVPMKLNASLPASLVLASMTCRWILSFPSSMARDEADAGPVGHSLAIPDAGGAGYVATLLSVDRGRRQSIVAPFAASVAVFAQHPAQIPLMPGEAFARLYQLTGGELRVLLALAQGLGAKEAADMFGISEPTVGTHLQRMFARTCTSRQAELLQLLQSATPPTKGRLVAIPILRRLFWPLAFNVGVGCGPHFAYSDPRRRCLESFRFQTESLRRSERAVRANCRLQQIDGRRGWCERDSNARAI